MSFFKKNIFKKIFSNLKTIIGFILLFVLIHFLLNFGAYSSRFNYYFSDNNNDEWTRNYWEKNQIIWANEEDTIEISSKRKKILPLVNLDFNQKLKKVWGLRNFNLEIYPNDNRIYIPKINQNAPISWTDLTEKNVENTNYLHLEKKLQQALQDGIVHYPGTALPGEQGNAVFTGHSSYYPWAPGDYKSVFALLDKVELGDEIIVYYQQIKYIYQITGKRIVKPTAMDVLKQNQDKSLLTLITCTPVGTDINRLIVTAELR